MHWKYSYNKIHDWLQWYGNYYTQYEQVSKAVHALLLMCWCNRTSEIEWAIFDSWFFSLMVTKAQKRSISSSLSPLVTTGTLLLTTSTLLPLVTLTQVSFFPVSEDGKMELVENKSARELFLYQGLWFWNYTRCNNVLNSPTQLRYNCSIVKIIAYISE